ncbi:hypothetical protein [Agarilytica rhodophyticola]|uniref:hypothetical protein n=1 Tax=Agarilytica rhodophyticola TaxID=1737490 RepID=UPI0013153EAD|nr:hypothetical protein [Agarilytica rhodophyticola]
MKYNYGNIAEKYRENFCSQLKALENSNNPVKKDSHEEFWVKTREFFNKLMNQK